VLYTHQKLKKSKTWQDGILRTRAGSNKALLFDDKGQCLESIFIKSQLHAGDNLESERYLITVEAKKANEKPFEDQPRGAEGPAVDRNDVKRSALPPRHLSVGLKRKFKGFQGPRQVEKKAAAMEGGEDPVMSPLSTQHQSPFPPKFFITSPLFSMVCKKDEDTKQRADLREDARIDNSRGRVSLSSVLSAPFPDRCEETEMQNSDQPLVKPESPLIAGCGKSHHQVAARGPVSHSIRSTAQIIALLKSKPTPGCREQTTPEVTGHLSRFQASGNVDALYNQTSSILPAYSGSILPAERLIQNTQPSPFTKQTVNDEKEWNAEALLHEQPRGKDVTGHRQDEKVDRFSQGLEDPCKTNSCFLRESSARPFGTESSVMNTPQENWPEGLQSGLQPRQRAGGAVCKQELSVDIPLAELGAVTEELNPLKGGVTQSAALRRHSRCQSVTDTEKEAPSDEGYPGGTSSQLCDCVGGDRGTIAEGSVNQTGVERELLGDRHSVEEIHGSPSSTEATSDKDLGGCAWVESKHSDNKQHPNNSVSDSTDSISCVSTSRITSAMDKRTAEDVVQLGCVKSPDADSRPSWRAKSDDIKPGSLLLALRSVYPLGKGCSSPEETARGETEFERVASVTEACKGGRTGEGYLNCKAVAENSPALPDLLNNIALLSALTQHSTALESLEKM
ncbi:ZGRF1 protein, partial [Rhinopomastus cyanomelas]|nr:ZGRF1 protein [Rhinopomastus cyanomelas]